MVPSRARQHNKAKRINDQRNQVTSRAYRLRSKAHYRKFRAWFRRRHPLCADPFGDHQGAGVVAGMDHVHNIKPVECHPELLCSEANCVSLCSRCHTRIEADERRGLPTCELFKGG